MSKSLKSTAFTAAAAGLMFNVAASAHWNENDAHSYDLSKHEDFIMNMSLPDGSIPCCNGDDVFVNLPEEENPDGGYTVTVPAGTVLFRDFEGDPVVELERDLTLVIPPDRILTAEQAYTICKELIVLGSTTCTAPTINVLYADPGSLATSEDPAYCYWPIPKGY